MIGVHGMEKESGALTIYLMCVTTDDLNNFHLPELNALFRSHTHIQDTYSETTRRKWLWLLCLGMGVTRINWLYQKKHSILILNDTTIFQSMNKTFWFDSRQSKINRISSWQLTPDACALCPILLNNDFRDKFRTKIIFFFCERLLLSSSRQYGRHRKS